MLLGIKILILFIHNIVQGHINSASGLPPDGRFETKNTVSS